MNLNIYLCNKSLLYVGAWRQLLENQTAKTKVRGFNALNSLMVTFLKRKLVKTKLLNRVYVYKPAFLFLVTSSTLCPPVSDICAATLIENRMR